MNILINFIGLIMIVIGTLLVQFNSPKNFTVIDGNGDWDKIEKRAARKNRLVTLGGFLTVIGAIVQFATLILNSK